MAAFSAHTGAQHCRTCGYDLCQACAHPGDAKSPEATSPSGAHREERGVDTAPDGQAEGGITSPATRYPDGVTVPPMHWRQRLLKSSSDTTVLAACSSTLKSRKQNIANLRSAERRASAAFFLDDHEEVQELRATISQLSEQAMAPGTSSDWPKVKTPHRARLSRCTELRPPVSSDAQSPSKEAQQYIPPVILAEVPAVQHSMLSTNTAAGPAKLFGSSTCSSAAPSRPDSRHGRSTPTDNQTARVANNTLLPSHLALLPHAPLHPAAVHRGLEKTSTPRPTSSGRKLTPRILVGTDTIASARTPTPSFRRPNSRSGVGRLTPTRHTAR